MTYFTYTTNLPTQDPIKNARAFTKLPRSVLLAPYLAINPYFVDFTNAIDTVFDVNVEAKLLALKNIRNMWPTSLGTEQKIANNQMLSFSDWGGTDRGTVISQVNLLGLELNNAGVIDDGSYRAFSRFLGSYWYEKGKNSLADFLSFCTNNIFVLHNLWTQDYLTFVPEGDPSIGTTIFNGGSWYPTTHVRLTVVNTAGFDINAIGGLFNEIANYNLVLESINSQLSFLVATGTQSLGTIVHSVVGSAGVGVGANLVQSPATQTISNYDGKAHVVGMALAIQDSYTFGSILPPGYV